MDGEQPTNNEEQAEQTEQTEQARYPIIITHTPPINSNFFNMIIAEIQRHNVVSSESGPSESGPVTLSPMAYVPMAHDPMAPFSSMEPMEPMEPMAPMAPMSPPSFMENLMNRTLHENTSVKHVASDEFIESLKEEEYTGEESLECIICQEKIISTNSIIKLPCGHIFHSGIKCSKEECSGIHNWLKLSNQCPICRKEYPSKELEQGSDQESGDEESDDQASELERIVRPVMLPSLGEIHNMVRQIIDEREEADLQAAILASMSTEYASASNETI